MTNDPKNPKPNSGNLDPPWKQTYETDPLDPKPKAAKNPIAQNLRQNLREDINPTHNINCTIGLTESKPSCMTDLSTQAITTQLPFHQEFLLSREDLRQPVVGQINQILDICMAKVFHRMSLKLTIQGDSDERRAFKTQRQEDGFIKVLPTNPRVEDEDTKHSDGSIILVGELEDFAENMSVGVARPNQLKEGGLGGTLLVSYSRRRLKRSIKRKVGNSNTRKDQEDLQEVTVECCPFRPSDVTKSLSLYLSLSRTENMAFSEKLLCVYLFSIVFFFTTILSLSLRTFSISDPNCRFGSTTDVHDLLPQYGFPKGILPKNIKSFYLSSTDNSFTLELTYPCYIQFDELVYYDRNIKGKLTYGKVSDVSGIQARKLFIWVSVTGMDVDDKLGMIEFHVGALSEKLPAKQFETIRDCKNKGCQESHPAVESI
ncbi:unnamed protein product [Ilex paraguariensis]|uniref:DUF538 domain-containing protein n=1 Tax=Ilex paraguariensis TaxID=185542 RepID=A0ABC8UW76_9AQUA